MANGFRESDCHDLFVSYAHKDGVDGWISAFCEALQCEYARFSPTPLRIFLDRRAIRSTDDWQHRIRRGLLSSKIMLAFVSPNYFASEYCWREWVQFSDFETSRSMLGEGIATAYYVDVPGFDEGDPERDTDDWRRNLRRRQFLDVRGWRKGGVKSLDRKSVRRRIHAFEQEIHSRLTRAEAAAASSTNIPPHNANFVGRLEQLRQLHETLALGQTGAITAVHGIGGIGKTALAFEYAHAFAAEYPGGRFVVGVEGIASIAEAIARIAEIPEAGVALTEEQKRDPTFESAAAAIRYQLQERGPCLIILDNVDELGILGKQQFDRVLPDRRQIQVLATSRLAVAEQHGITALPLDTLPTADALRLLERYRPFAGDEERNAAARIVDRLGGHALACEVVAVFLWQSHDLSWLSYSHQLQARGIQALDSAGTQLLTDLSRHTQKLVGPLLEPTLASLSSTEWLAMEFVALMPPDHVPVEWLRGLLGRRLRGSPAGKNSAEPDSLVSVMRRLAALRLLTPVDWNIAAPVTRVHRIVQDAVIARMDRGKLRGISRRIDRYIAMETRRSLVMADSDSGTAFSGSLPHVLRHALMNPLRAYKAAARVGTPVFTVLTSRGMHHDARSLSRQALAVFRRADRSYRKWPRLLFFEAAANNVVGDKGDSARMLRVAVRFSDRLDRSPWVRFIYAVLQPLSRWLCRTRLFNRFLNQSERVQILMTAMRLFSSQYAALDFLSSVYSEQGLFSEADDARAQADAILRRWIGECPTGYDMGHDFEFARHLNRQGRNLEALQIMARLDKEGMADLAPAIGAQFYLNFADVLGDTDQPDRALAMYNRSLQAFELIYGTRAHAHPAACVYKIGCMLLKLGRNQEGVERLIEFLRLIESASLQVDEAWPGHARSLLRRLTSQSEYDVGHKDGS